MDETSRVAEEMLQGAENFTQAVAELLQTATPPQTKTVRGGGKVMQPSQTTLTPRCAVSDPHLPRN